MSDQIQIVLIAVGCTSAVGLAGMGVIRLLRRASLRLSIQASGAVPVLAIVAGTLGTRRGDVPVPARSRRCRDGVHHRRHCRVRLQLAARAAGRVRQRGAAAGRAVPRRRGRPVPAPGLPLAAEFAALSRELADTSAKLAKSRRGSARSSSPAGSWWPGSRMTCAPRWPDCARWPRHWRTAWPPTRPATTSRCGPRPNGWRPWSMTCSSCPGSSRAPCTCRPTRSRSMTWSATCSPARRRWRGSAVSGWTAGRPGSPPSAPTRASCPARSRTCWPTPSGTPRRAAACTSRRGRRAGTPCWRSPTAAAASRKPTLPHVFDLAWRGTDARSPAPDSGAGLGLAIVRGVAEAHRGSVRVMNTEGGCCFEMWLPACR